MNLSTTNIITMHILRKPLPSRSHRTRKNKTKHNGKILYSKPYNMDKNTNGRLYTMSNKQSVC